MTRELPKVGDEILVYATVESVTPDAWQKPGPPCIEVEIHTADAGSATAWASWWEPVPPERDVEALAEAAHDAWLEAAKARGRTSWPNEKGIEQMVPYEVLGEDIREFDRVVVRAMLKVLDAEPGRD